MPLRGASCESLVSRGPRVLRFGHAAPRRRVPVFFMAAATLNMASGVQSLAPQSQDTLNGIVIDDAGQLEISQARKSLMRNEALGNQQLLRSESGVIVGSASGRAREDRREEALEVAKMEVAEAAKEVHREEALEEVMAAAQEVSRGRKAQARAEERLRSAAHNLDEVNREGYDLHMLVEAGSAPRPPACLTCKCAFVDRHGVNSNCDAQYALRLLVAKWVNPNATAIEFGGMYGTTSCSIASKQRNSGKLLVVEPDHRLWVTLETNRLKNKCNFTTVRGLLGKEDKKAIEASDVMQFIPINSTHRDPVAAAADIIIPHLTLKEVQRRYSLKFDTAIIDCDGCLPTLAQENIELFPQLDLLVVADHSQAETDELKKLEAMGGFTEVEVVNHYHVLRRNCGAVVPCSPPAATVAAPAPRDKGPRPPMASPPSVRTVNF